MTRSEEFVHRLARDACLSLWTYASPQGKDSGKELCDTLVACPPDIIVISVKEVQFAHNGGNLDVAFERWERKAVKESVRQVYGAVRRLSNVENVTKVDGSAGVDLGPKDSRRIHRIAIAIGAEGVVPLPSRDFGHGFVHVFDAETFLILMRELDTIADLVQYLADRVELLEKGLRGAVVCTEPDLLGLYVINNRSFARLRESDMHLIVLDGIWDDFTKSPEYSARAEANDESYIWDRLIEQLHSDYLTNNMEFGGDLASVDQITRIMARENRTERRALAQAFLAFMNQRKTRARFATGASGATYVFLKAPHAEDRKYRTRELQMRLWVAREEAHKLGRDGPVVGLATEVPEPGSGFSLDAALLQKIEWTTEDSSFVEAMRVDLELFVRPVLRRTSVDEFPR